MLTDDTLQDNPSLGYSTLSCNKTVFPCQLICKQRKEKSFDSFINNKTKKKKTQQPESPESFGWQCVDENQSRGYVCGKHMLNWEPFLCASALPELHVPFTSQSHNLESQPFDELHEFVTGLSVIKLSLFQLLLSFFSLLFSAAAGAMRWPASHFRHAQTQLMWNLVCCCIWNIVAKNNARESATGSFEDKYKRGKKGGYVLHVCHGDKKRRKTLQTLNHNCCYTSQPNSDKSTEQYRLQCNNHSVAQGKALRNIQAVLTRTQGIKNPCEHAIRPCISQFIE